MRQIATMIIVLTMLTVNSQTSAEKVDRYVIKMMQRNEIPGAALAVMRGEEVVFKKYYGSANLETKKPIDERTLFKLHSLSKVFVSTAIFQLIADNKLSLSDPIGKYVEGLPQAWRTVEIQHLLTHSSGLPDIIKHEATTESEHRSKVFADPIEFAPGERFSYNQTNFWLLNRLIAKVSGSPLEDYLLEKQFNGSKNALVFAQDKKAANRATEYFASKEGSMQEKEFNVPAYMYGAAGIALTLDNFITWNKRLDSGELLKSQLKNAMWDKFEYDNGFDYAYGWGRESINNRKVVGFSGGTIVSLRKYIDDDMTVIFLSTGYRHFPNVNGMTNYVAGLVDEDLKSTEAIAGEQLLEGFLEKPVSDGIQLYKKLLTNDPSLQLEGVLNSIGYRLAGRDDYAGAIAVFELNTQENPNSWNVWDSLAEGYEMKGDTQAAIANYKKSVSLNPENQHGIDKLKTLQKK